MPSTYTDNGGIELPASGEQSATWGNTVNTNMEILDRITNGVGQLGLSGSSSTLTISDGQVSTGILKYWSCLVALLTGMFLQSSRTTLNMCTLCGITPQ